MWPWRSISDDVHLVGDELGATLRRLGSERLFERVEAMRLAARGARECADAGDEEGAERRRCDLERIASELSAEEALGVARAFTLYFQLVNLAEDVQRGRELRRREREEEAPVPESWADTVRRAAEAGAGRQEVLAALGETRVTYVFTAHPTEARRRTSERLLEEAREVLETLDRHVLAPAERRRVLWRLRSRTEALWQHASEREGPPDVLEEVRAGLWYLERVLLDVVPRVHRALWHALQERFGPIDPLRVPLPVRFGSWMGGDRDGNPFVTDAVMERTLEMHREAVLARYRRDLRALVDPLAAVEERLPSLEVIRRALGRAAERVPECLAAAERRNPREPMRRLLTVAMERLERSRTLSAGGYGSPEELLQDLHALREALLDAGARALADGELLDLMQRVRCFGFHLAALDVREDSEAHREAVAELLGEPGYPAWPDARRRRVLRGLRLPAVRSNLSEGTRRILSCFETMARMQGRFGPEALGTYIVSMCRAPADVLEVLRLAELHGLASHLDVVPLLETPRDLASAEELLETLLRDETYRAHLRARGDRQELLVGYSDSMKVGGVLASRVRVWQAQRAAARACRAYGVRLRVFHGRGGSVSRGGGPTHRAIGGLPREAFEGELRITEQGEMRAYNFASPDLAARYLEQTAGAAWLARLEARAAKRSVSASQSDLLDRLAERAERAYRELVEDPFLLTYFHEATPFRFVTALRLASRPSRRRGARAGLRDLRAIPWVFSWSQSRHLLTGWYGVGSALQEVLEEEGGRARLVELYRASRFFRDLLDNVEMALAKADLGIAARYAALCGPQGQGEAFFERIRDEHERTVRAVLTVSGQRRLLEDDRVLARSIALRNPYVDPLSYLQVQALRRVRSGGDEAIAWERVGRITVQGIAAGLRHTG